MPRADDFATLRSIKARLEADPIHPEEAHRGRTRPTTLAKHGKQLIWGLGEDAQAL